MNRRINSITTIIAEKAVKIPPLLLLSFLFSLLAFITIPFYYEERIISSAIIVGCYLVNFLCVWNISGRVLRPFNMFLLTYALFILGRFIAILLGYDGEWWAPNFFLDYIPSELEKLRCLQSILLFLFFSTLGYYLSHKYKCKQDKTLTVNSSVVRQFIRLLFIPLLLYTIIKGYSTLRSALSGGYLSLYLGSQTSEYSGTGILSVIPTLCFGLAYGFGSKKDKFGYLLIYTINVVFSIAIGARGGLGALLLFFIWLYSKKHKISLLKLGLFGLLAVSFLLFIFQFSIRSEDSSGVSNSAFKNLTNFLYEQGISLSVFNASCNVESFPMLIYFQNLILGISVIYSKITAVVLQPWDVSFASNISYTLNPSLFLSGYGLGWTLMGDFFFYGGKSLFGYSLISIIFSYAIGRLEINSKKSKIAKTIIYTIIFQLLLLPRVGLNAFMPMLCYLFLLLAIFSIISKFLQVKKIRIQ